jgi:hypothetical protein
MTQAENEALANAMDVCGIANAVQDAMQGDVLRTAKGLITIAMVLAKSDPGLRSVLGRYCMQAARELDSHLAVTCLTRMRLH